MRYDKNYSTLRLPNETGLSIVVENKVEKIQSRLL